MSDGYCGACKKYSYVERYGREGWQFGYCQTTTCIRTWERKKRRHAGKHRKNEEDCASRNMSRDQIGIGSSDWQEQQQWAAAGFGDNDINAVHHWKKNSWTPCTWHGWVDSMESRASMEWPQWNQGHQWSEANGDCSRGSQPCSRTSWKTVIDATRTPATGACSSSEPRGQSPEQRRERDFNARTYPAEWLHDERVIRAQRDLYDAVMKMMVAEDRNQAVTTQWKQTGQAARAAVEAKELMGKRNTNQWNQAADDGDAVPSKVRATYDAVDYCISKLERTAHRVLDERGYHAQGHQCSEANGDCSRGSQPWSRTSWKPAIDATNTKKRWGAWAAGVVAISMRSREHCVCLVEKYDGQLGFPKGGAEEAEEFMPDGGHMATAMREWQEETNLQTEGLTLMDARAGLHVDKFNCHYFMAKWDPTWLPALPAAFIQPFFHPEMGVGTSWEITDDPEIVRAHWMDCSTALARLSRTRGQILCETVQYLIKKQADKESPVQTCP